MGVLQTHRWEHTTLNVLKTGDVLGFYKQVLNPSSSCELGDKNKNIPFAWTVEDKELRGALKRWENLRVILKLLGPEKGRTLLKRSLEEL